MDDHHFKVGSPEFTGYPSGADEGSTIAVTMDHQPVGRFIVTNAYRTGVFDLFKNLKPRYSLALISGDNPAEEARLKVQMGDDSPVLFEQSPHDKLDFIQRLQDQHHARVMMVGDGLNDAGALQESHVGIAVCDDDNNFTPAADGIIHASKVSALDKILQYIRSGKKIIHFSFGISILYNSIGLFFAVQGTLSPVIAAILMPSSSITIILITYGLSQLLAKKLITPSPHHPITLSLHDIAPSPNKF
jgi:Cu+-exporting ATPase